MTYCHPHPLPKLASPRVPTTQKKVGLLPMHPFAAMLNAVSCLHRVLYFTQDSNILSSRQCIMTGINQGFATSGLLMFWARSLCGVGALLCTKTPNSSRHPYPVDVSSIPQLWHPKMSPDTTTYSLGGQHPPPVENYWSNPVTAILFPFILASLTAGQ